MLDYIYIPVTNTQVYFNIFYQHTLTTSAYSTSIIDSSGSKSTITSLSRISPALSYHSRPIQSTTAPPSKQY